jgi:flagellar biosynthesis/type III secretory pathway chaperone
MSLKDVIQQELVAYKDILSKAKQKKEALLKNDVAFLDRIVAHEGSIIKTVRELEGQRESLIRSIAGKHGFDTKTATLADIADLFPEGREALLILKSELVQVLAEIERLNAANKALLDTHLQYSSFCINLLTGGVSTLNTYSYSGRISDAQERKTLVLDRMV